MRTKCPICSYHIHKHIEGCKHMYRAYAWGHMFAQITCVTTSEKSSSILSRYICFKAIFFFFFLTFNTFHPKTVSLSTQRVAQVTDQQPSNEQCFCFRVFCCTSTVLHLSYHAYVQLCACVCVCVGNQHS